MDQRGSAGVVGGQAVRVPAYRALLVDMCYFATSALPQVVVLHVQHRVPHLHAGRAELHFVPV
eukprot:364682-Chlamydomonas_euryale.AAC.10